MEDRFLTGIRVVELGTHVAIPYCARELADLGAEVIKVEPPQGEAYRSRMGMLFHLPHEAENNMVFMPYNANKKSLCLNLKDEDGKQALLKLLATADVFLTNTREAALGRLGLDFDTLRKLYPRLIIGSVSGFGSKGADKDRGGYDATSFWSTSGAIPEWSVAEGKVFKPFYGFGDSITAAQLTAGIMAALYRREKNGQGDIVRSALLAAGLWHNICGLLRYQVGNQFPKSYYDPLLPLDNFYRTKDGKWLLTAEERWDIRHKAYFEMFGMPELSDDPNWNSMRAYLTDIPTKTKFFEEQFAKLTSEEITVGLTKAGAVFEFLKSTDDVCTNPQAWDNQFLRKITSMDGTEMTIANIPLEFESQDFVSEVTPAPQLGQDTGAILSELGYTSEQITEMNEKKAAVLY